jgi:hypothetical protein
MNAGTGFVKLMRSETTTELLSTDPQAFLLLALIAYRARYRPGESLMGLQPGEALIGDYRACGLTEQKYRSAKQRLAKYGFATFKTTSKGTVARIVDTRVFSINGCEGNGHSNGHPTDGQRTPNERPTTNEEGEEGKEGKNVKRESTRAPFVKPTETEVIEYGREIGYESEATAFLDYYDAKGWRIGTTPMRDWKAALRTWQHREDKKHHEHTGHREQKARREYPEHITVPSL